MKLKTCKEGEINVSEKSVTYFYAIYFLADEAVKSNYERSHFVFRYHAEINTTCYASKMLALRDTGLFILVIQSLFNLIQKSLISGIDIQIILIRVGVDQHAIALFEGSSRFDGNRAFLFFREGVPPERISYQ